MYGRALLHQHLRCGGIVLVHVVGLAAVAHRAHLGPHALASAQGHRVVAARVDHHLVKAGDRRQGGARHIGPDLAVFARAADVDAVKACHVVDILGRNLQHVGRGVGGHVDALDALDAADFIEPHGADVGHGQQVHLGAAAQTNRVKAGATADQGLGGLTGAVVLQVAHIAGGQHDRVVALACVEAVHAAAARQGVVARRADQGFTGHGTGEFTCPIDRGADPLGAPQDQSNHMAARGRRRVVIIGGDHQIVQAVTVDVTSIGQGMTGNASRDLEALAGGDVAAGVDGHTGTAGIAIDHIVSLQVVSARPEGVHHTSDDHVP